MPKRAGKDASALPAVAILELPSQLGAKIMVSSGPATRQSLALSARGPLEVIFSDTNPPSERHA